MISSKPQTYLSFGGGVKLLSEEWYVEASGHQWSKPGFRALCRNLRVPMIEIGSKRYVDMVVFEGALSSVLRVGEEDFFTPGCLSTKHGNRKVSVVDKDVERDWRKIMGELLVKRKLNGAEVTAKVRTGLREVARRMTMAGLHMLPSRAQEELEAEADREQLEARRG